MFDIAAQLLVELVPLSLQSVCRRTSWEDALKSARAHTCAFFEGLRLSLFAFRHKAFLALVGCELAIGAFPPATKLRARDKNEAFV